MVVKGSKQYRPVVTHHRPWRRFVWILGLFLAVSVAIVASYYRGYDKAQSDYQQAMEEWNHLHELATQQAEQLQQLNQQVANTQVGSSVNQQAMEVLRQQIVTLNEQITSLQESNNFYRQLMDPPENNKGITIASFKVEASAGVRSYHYELVIQQLTKEHHPISGRVNITLVGNMGEALHTYAITELSSKPSKADIPLKLRFYQTIVGDLVLPEGFEVKRVDVSAEKSGAAAVTASFDWVVKE